jgi:hypothetical protein
MGQLTHTYNLDLIEVLKANVVNMLDFTYIQLYAERRTSSPFQHEYQEVVMPFIVPLLGSRALISGIDAGNEAWNFSIYGKILTAGNLAAQETLWATLWAAAMALVLGHKKTTAYGNEINYAYTQPTNGAAREIALRISAKDATTQERFSYQLATLDPTIPVYILNVDAKDAIDPSTPAAMTDFIAAFEAFAVSPITGNALGVYGVRVVRGKK